MREGRELEQLVAALEKATSTNPLLEIKSPYIMKDRITGANREHDVGIIVKQDHHGLVIALECRDRSRNVTVPEIEAFAQKCNDTGVNRGVIVSSKGFAEDALTKAKHLNISCYTLKEAQDISWLQTEFFDMFSTSMKHCNWVFVPIKDYETKPAKFHIEDAQGVIINTHQLNLFAHESLKGIGYQFHDKVGMCRIKRTFNMEGHFIVDESSGERRALKLALVDIDVDVSHTQVPISKLIYRDEVSGTNVIEAGVVPVIGDGINGELLFASGANGVTISFRPGAMR